MNRSLRKVSLVAAILFFSLLINLTFSYVTRTDALNNRPENTRIRDEEFGQPRGAILASNTAIAETVPTEGSGRFDYQRRYPAGTGYSVVTGFYSYTYGRSGLEQTYNAQLSGTSDSQALDRIIGSMTGDRQRGATLQTTQDPRAQDAAVKALRNRKGAVVALDYTTGAIKAYAVSPTFDANDLSTTDLKASQTAWETLNADAGRPLSDRAGREIYPPGSVFKLVTAAAALENGYTPASMIASPDKLTLPGTNTQLPNAGSCGGEQTTLSNALTVSCNTAFANVGIDLGADKLRDQARKFGFDAPIVSDVNAVASRFPAAPDPAQTGLSAIGQFDVAATPLQMAMVAAGIANDGVVMKPFFVSEIRNDDLSVLQTHNPRELSAAISPGNATDLQNMMVNVVTSGTGRRAQVPGVRVGGKTGTAQTDVSRKNYAWFTGFADDPKVAICVFIEDDAALDDLSGGAVAGPVFKSVLEAMR